MPPPDDLLIRPFAPADQAAARALIVAGLGEHFGAIDETLNPDLDDIAAGYPAATGTVFLVAERAGALVGTAALTTEDLDDPEGWIVRVAVDPAQRRQGIAAALVAHLIALADDRRMELLLVETNKDWTAAIRLYEQCGFSTYDEDDVSVYMHLNLQQQRQALRDSARLWRYPY